jgi:hypothetical protein
MVVTRVTRVLVTDLMATFAQRLAGSDIALDGRHGLAGVVAAVYGADTTPRCSTDETTGSTMPRRRR